MQRIFSSYRTFSEPAVLVIAGYIPIDLLASKKKWIFETPSDVEKKIARIDTRNLTKERWQRQWGRDTRARWTAILILKIDVWIDRNHGEVNYYFAQFLSGAESNNAYHTFFICDRWSEPRRRLEMQVGSIKRENVVGVMIEGEGEWAQVGAYVREVLQQKKREENEKNALAEP